MRLIDADELKKKAYPFPCAIGVEYAATIRAINDAPTVDAVQVVRGEWLTTDMYSRYPLVCSKCHHAIEMTKRSNYCPNCGARMSADSE